MKMIKTATTTHRARVVSHQVIGHTRSSLSIEVNLSNHGSSAYSQVLSLHCFSQESKGTRASFPLCFGHLETSYTILRTRPVVEIVVCSESCRSSNLKESLAKRVLISNILHDPFSIFSVELGGSPSHVFLRKLEVRKNIGGRPPRNSPLVVILCRSAMVQANVCTRRSTKDLRKQ